MNSSTDRDRPGLPPELIPVAYVRRAHGIRGAVVLKPLSDDESRLAVGASFVTDSKTVPELSISSSQPHKDGLLVRFDDVTDRDQAERLRGVSLLISPAERRELDADEFWVDQLIGMRVVDLGGADLGTVTAVALGSAQDRLQIDRPGGGYEIPFVAALVPEVDLAEGVIVIDPPEGMYDR